jgi:hypothetical protein
MHPWKANCIGSAHNHIDWQNQGEKIRTIRETETDVGYGNMTRPGGRPMADVYRFLCVQPLKTNGLAGSWCTGDGEKPLNTNVIFLLAERTLPLADSSDGWERNR